ncbi:MAG TPA: FAD-dependent monooxygenase [Burkholderiaceae bacterium]|jgi:flavin-dependent dehydrogenase
MAQRFDVAIAGGGPAGAAAALTLARLGRSVLLADAAPADAIRVGEGLPPSVHSLLQALGLLERFRADGHRASHGTVSVWGINDPQYVDFMHQAHGHGYQLDRRRFDAMLKAAADEAGVQICDQTRLRVAMREQAADRSQADPTMRLQLSSGNASREIECRWLIHAGGRAAATLRSCGVARCQTDRLIAFHVLLHADGTTDFDGRTMIEAGVDGWWYSVLLPAGERLVVYLCDQDIGPAERAALLSAEGFIAKLHAAPHLRQLCLVHGYRPICTPRGADASSGRLEYFTGDGWLAVGDAALSFDPLSSQGISNALYTGILGARAIDAALDCRLEALEHYQRHLTQIYAAYLGNRAIFYGYETRWRAHPFWQRRHAA